MSSQQLEPRRMMMYFYESRHFVSEGHQDSESCSAAIFWASSPLLITIRSNCAAKGPKKWCYCVTPARQTQLQSDLWQATVRQLATRRNSVRSELDGWSLSGLGREGGKYVSSKQYHLNTSLFPALARLLPFFLLKRIFIQASHHLLTVAHSNHHLPLPGCLHFHITP